MLADVMHCFPGFSYDFVLNDLTFRQFILWHMQAMRILHDIPVNLRDTSVNTKTELDTINDNFEWDEKNRKWIGKR